MKKSILVLCTFFAMGAIGTSCMTPAQKVKNAQDNVKEANKDLDKANKEYLADIESYRKETLDKIAANDRSIAEFSAKIENETGEAKAEYQKKMNELRQKNNEMKDKMNEYKVEGRDKWQIFKAEFSHDMDELGKAFKDLVVKNTK